MGISDTAIGICDANRGKNYSGCGRCPIHAECTTGCAGGEESMTAWQQKVNDAAERFSRGPE
jgi:hypothetical protein